MRNRVGIERINEFPAKRMGGMGGKTYYMYLCPCGETKWGNEQSEKFKAWRRLHIETVAAKGLGPYCVWRGHKKNC
jgi:hypothetical protein